LHMASKERVAREIELSLVPDRVQAEHAVVLTVAEGRVAHEQLINDKKAARFDAKDAANALKERRATQPRPSVRQALEEARAAGADERILEQLVRPLLAAFPQPSDPAAWAQMLANGLRDVDVPDAGFAWAVDDIQDKCEFLPKPARIVHGVKAFAVLREKAARAAPTVMQCITKWEERGLKPPSMKDGLALLRWHWGVRDDCTTADKAKISSSEQDALDAFRKSRPDVDWEPKRSEAKRDLKRERN